MKLPKQEAFVDTPRGANHLIAACGERARTRVSHRQTRGKLSVVEFRCPLNFGPPRHLHREDDEVLIVRQGVIAIWLPDRTMLARSGDLVYLPRRVAHAWCAIGTEEPILEIITAPGHFESWLRLITERRFEQDNLEALREIASEAGMVVIGDPLTAEEVSAIVNNERIGCSELQSRAESLSR